MLVVSNNIYYKSALDKSNAEKRMFMIGFSEFTDKNIRLGNCIENLQFLPHNQRPHLLTEVVVERIKLDNVKSIRSHESVKLAEFIHGKEFLYEYLRLYRHALELKSIKWTKDNETLFANSLRKISFEQCSGIETELFMKKNENGKLGKEILIENTDKKKFIHTEKLDDRVCVYFDSSDPKWKQNVRKEITVHLNELTNEHSFDAKTSIILSEIVGMFDNPHGIEMYLSQERIKEYEFEIDTDEKHITPPNPGEIVEERFHRYLDNDYGLIYEFDFKFVALEIDDPSFDEEIEEAGYDCEQDNGEYSTPTYIFVHIIRKLEQENDFPLLQEYEIDCGSGTLQIVKGFQLYKFIREQKKKPQSNCDIVIFSENVNTPNDKSQKSSQFVPQTFKEACKDVRKILLEAWKKDENDKKRIVKRLMLKWHPDKNPENVNLCTKVFQYIQQCLQRLENGLDLKDEEGDSDFNSSGNSFSSNTSGHHSSSSWWSGNTRYDRSWRRYDQGRRFNESRYSNTSSNSSSQSSRGCYSNFYHYWRSSYRYANASHEPYHWYSMARVWHKQAELDLKQAKDSMKFAEIPQYSWFCYNAHQAAEKALKAAWYSKDANKIKHASYGHDLEILAIDLDSQVRIVASDLSSLTGRYSDMRYPRTSGRPQLPSEIYTRSTATVMIELAENIVTLVKKIYIK